MTFKPTYQVNPGFLISAIGSLTLKSSELVAGNQSIKGAYDGAGAYTAYLQTDRSVLPLNPNTTYQVSFNYIILTTPSAGFEVLFYSPQGGMVGNFLNSTLIQGVSGDTGTATLTSTLANFPDYQARWNVVGTGAIAIDEIKITNVSTGAVVAYENAEEGTVSVDPSIALLKAGLIKDVVRGAEITVDFSQYDTVGVHSYWYRSALIADLNHDGKNEVLFTVTPYVQYRVPVLVLGNASNTAVPVGQAPAVENLTTTYFPNGAPKPMNSETIVYKDINQDGLKDLVFAETGRDSPPWTGAKISVAMASTVAGKTVFTDVSAAVPDTTMRTYAIAVGDFTGDGRQDILLGDQETYGANTWSGSNTNASHLLNYANGQFTELANPIKGWADPKNRLPSHTDMEAADFNSDGYDDLLVTNSWSGANATVIFGSKTGLDESTLKRLPAGPLGQGGFEWATTNGQWPLTQVVYGTETREVVADFNHDGRPDIFAMQNEYFQYPPGTATDTTAANLDDVFKNGGGLLGGKCAFYTLINMDGSNFQIQSSSDADMPSRLYDKLFCEDINADGHMDVIGHYLTFPRANDDNGTLWSTTFFLNDGNGNFTAIEGVKALPQLAVFPYADTSRAPKPEVGAIFPLKNENGLFTGLQVFSEANQTGKYIAAEFTTSQINQLKPDVTSHPLRILATEGTRNVAGSQGVDVLQYSEAASHYKLNKNDATMVVTHNAAVHTLSGIERIQFADQTLAIDMADNQAGGITAKILGAVFGKQAVTNKAYVGIGLSFLDAGWTYDNLAGLALNAAGAVSNDQIVSLLWTNVMGSVPTSDIKSQFIPLLEGGMTPGALAHLAADTSFNTTNINLVGLAQTGLVYTPV
jgi:hypothetical protein